jgi:pimeloyl-ACP methyl ester carboxylesterase
MYAETLPPDSGFVPARGLQHHVLRWGDPAWVSPTAPLLVMVHGYMDVARSFQFVVDALYALGQRRHVIAPDLRGFGHTRSREDAYWFPDYLGDLDALLDALAPGAQVDLLGHSMGGNVVMQYAGVRPERIRRLVNLEGFGLPRTEPSEGPLRLRTWLDELKQPQLTKPYASFEALAARLLRNNPRLHPDKAHYLAGHHAQMADRGVELLADGAHRRTNPMLYRVEEMLAAYRAITAPVLWVEGTGNEHDLWWRGKYTKTEFHERLDQVADVTRETLAGAGHMLHHDQPEALAELLARFLSAP